MTKQYYQLTPQERYQIQVLITSGHSQTIIAKQIGYNKSTICRELKRNVPKRGNGAKVHDAQKAHAKTLLRHKQKRRIPIFQMG